MLPDSNLPPLPPSLASACQAMLAVRALNNAAPMPTTCAPIQGGRVERMYEGRCGKHGCLRPHGHEGNHSIEGADSFRDAPGFPRWHDVLPLGTTPPAARRAIEVGG